MGDTSNPDDDPPARRPDVEPHIFGLDGRKVNPEDHYRELVDRAVFGKLRTLRAEIVRVLGKYGITVIPEEVLDRPLRWLRAREDVIVGETVTVRDAFFVRSV
jgi:hypothetical protein